MSISSKEFNHYKPLLFSLGYRMLGSVTDAEDLVQETFLKCYQSEISPLNPKAYLCKVMTNLCLDLLKSSQRQREQYIGEWNPVPLATDSLEPSELLIEKESLSIAYLRMMEHLKPDERAVLLLREAFHFPYKEIAQMVNKEVPNCRKLYSRAKAKITTVEAENLSYKQNLDLIEQFISAFQSQQTTKLLQLLSDEVILYTDGGGVVKSALRPIKSPSHIIAFFNGVSKKTVVEYAVSISTLNTQPALIIYINGDIYSVIQFFIKHGEVTEIYMTSNPNKLNHLHSLLPFDKGIHKGDS
ncbi:RNA polymerase sigma-70 factor [Bacillus sp. JCM 19034]|uniref:RNA polymerase sigma-70 factor n=1 Tax=Bacillus sp. JCM 19034 TaxID=1481928 RepID=UPI000784A0B1|nr:RNA polymerase sigma-70 factor [Bacillus sp. JCM 19034]